MERNKKKTCDIQKECLNYSGDHLKAVKNRIASKIKNLQDEIGALTMDEELALNEELERDMKLNPIYKKEQQLEKIKSKFKKRQDYMLKNYQEMKKGWDEDKARFISQKNRELEALQLDPEDYQLYVLNDKEAENICEKMDGLRSDLQKQVEAGDHSPAASSSKTSRWSTPRLTSGLAPSGSSLT